MSTCVEHAKRVRLIFFISTSTFLERFETTAKKLRNPFPVLPRSPNFEFTKSKFPLAFMRQVIDPRTQPSFGFSWADETRPPRLIPMIILIILLFVSCAEAGDKKKALKPRLFVDFTRITDSGTPYSEPLAEADFGVVVDFHRNNHLFLIDQADRVAFEKVLRAVFPARKTGPEDSGGRFGVSLLPSHHYTITYAVKFPPHFHWASGGMLPGICGGRNCHCGTEPENFVVTAGWDARGQLVMELCSRNQSGEKFSYTVTTNYALPRGEWIDLTLDVQLNRPDENNGFVAVTVNNTFFDSLQNVTLRSSATVEIDTFLYATFFANGDSSTNRRSSRGPATDVYADFDDITLVKAS